MLHVTSHAIMRYRDHAVVTILPADCVIGCLDRRRGHHDHQEHADV